MRDKFWIAKDNIGLSIIPKNASTSIRNVVGMSDVYDNEEVKQFDTRIAFMRCPFDRLESAYSFFYYLNKKTQPANQRVPASSWEEFVDHSLTTKDAHWEPQLSLIGDAATHYEKVSDLLDVWGKYFEGFYPWVANKVTRREVDSSYRRDELEIKYKQDLELWHSL